MAATISIAFISPNGSTRKVAETISDQLSRCGATAVLTDLSIEEETSSLIEAMNTDDETLLFIGSPVYANLAVAQDCRGRFDSGGADTVFRDDGRDGIATLEWIADQDWCNGSIASVRWRNVTTS